MTLSNAPFLEESKPSTLFGIDRFPHLFVWRVMLIQLGDYSWSVRSFTVSVLIKIIPVLMFSSELINPLFMAQKEYKVDRQSGSSYSRSMEPACYVYFHSFTSFSLCFLIFSLFSLPSFSSILSSSCLFISICSSSSFYFFFLYLPPPFLPLSLSHLFLIPNCFALLPSASLSFFKPHHHHYPI